jgi:hypothetical protein
VAKIIDLVEMRYVIAGGALLAETDSSGTIKAYYVYGLKILIQLGIYNEWSSTENWFRIFMGLYALARPVIKNN